MLNQGPGVSAVCVPGTWSLSDNGDMEAAWSLEGKPKKARVMGGLALIASQPGHLLSGPSSSKSPRPHSYVQCLS